jgi:hypothetical protein
VRGRGGGARVRCLFWALSTPAAGASVLWRRGAAKFGAPAAAAAAWVWAWPRDANWGGLALRELAQRSSAFSLISGKLRPPTPDFSRRAESPYRGSCVEGFSDAGGCVNGELGSCDQITL